MEVRPVPRHEMDELLPLIAGYQKFYGAEPDVERNRSFFSRFLDPSDEGLLLGAWSDGALAGFATLYWFFSSTKAADSVLMNDLFVRDDLRGAGIGRALINSALDEARQRGAAHLEWFTAPDNLVAQRLYDSMAGAFYMARLRDQRRRADGQATDQRPGSWRRDGPGQRSVRGRWTGGLARTARARTAPNRRMTAFSHYGHSNRVVSVLAHCFHRPTFTPAISSHRASDPSPRRQAAGSKGQMGCKNSALEDPQLH